ncbi:TORTIFOLIA1-like protein 3 isoform X2 [Malania oleifera]|uniref:TORTIFOLIA1-like protein 3 isoform X2 n=1 Tax=Malania oleifera TaxID=397392 RepID=UPI0025AE12FD|nr:TORTIFOLIA1-like protein 3 isoform X2 [Malania oleifera]
MALPKSQPRDLKQRVFTCLSKLADRDTQSLAAAELEEIAAGLSPTAVPSFLSCLQTIDAASKSPVRTHSVRLLSLLSRHHRDALSPSLSKMLAAVLRRLRDPDSAVRSACVDAISSMASQITTPPFSAFLKPLSGALFTEQELNSQIGCALCLSAAINAAPDPEPAQLQKLVPKLIKLLKSDSFKAKPALLTLVGSVIEAGGVSSYNALKNLVPCMMEFVSSDDWAARKASAEAFVKLAVVDRNILSEFKSSCLKKFENRKYDKVKAVRDTMNQMLEAWKEIPDLSDDVSPPPRSQSSSKENVSDGHLPPVDSEPPRTVKKQMANSRLPSSNSSFATTARKKTAMQSSNNRRNPMDLGRLDHKNPSDWEIEISVPHGVCEDEHRGKGEKIVERVAHEETRFLKPETKRALFSKNYDDKVHRVGGFRSGSRVVPCHDENSESTGVVHNATEYPRKYHKDSEDLSLIRKQLVQIENQQSNLLDLVQKFMGSSQNGMHSLETRVHGLELALDEISFDLAVSTGRMSNTRSPGTTCCLLPGARFLSSKFWRRTDGRHSIARFSSSSGIPSAAALHDIADGNGNWDKFKLQNQRFQHGGNGGFIMNPLAEIHSDSRGILDVSSNRILKNVQSATSHAIGTFPANNINRFSA